MCGKFVKSLPFYYHTSTHHRFLIGEMPSFSMASSKEGKKRRVPRRELLCGGIEGRVTMAERGAGSVRATFHNVAVELPPPPSRSGHILMIHVDHSYSSQQ